MTVGDERLCGLHILNVIPGIRFRLPSKKKKKKRSLTEYMAGAGLSVVFLKVEQQMRRDEQHGEQNTCQFIDSLLVAVSNLSLS